MNFFVIPTLDAGIYHNGLSTEFLSETSQGASPIMTKKMFFEHSLTMNEVLFYSAGYAEAHVVGEGSWGVSDSAHNTTR